MQAYSSTDLTLYGPRVRDQHSTNSTLHHRGPSAPGYKVRLINGTKCGFRAVRECPRPYTAADVEASALLWGPERERASAMLVRRHTEARADCRRRSTSALASGGWCLGHGMHPVSPAGPAASLHSYKLPKGHFPPDSIVVRTLHELLTQFPTHSLADFGAGIGQYGHHLLSLDSSHRYTACDAPGCKSVASLAERPSDRPCHSAVASPPHSVARPCLVRGRFDGAGNIEEATDGFVRFADLTLPLSLTRADWVLSLEAGEHVPRENEFMFVRNLHAHNCVGLILSWANRQQGGLGHVNPHDAPYLLSLFTELGYEQDERLLAALRAPRDGGGMLDVPLNFTIPVLSQNLLALRRRTPACITNHDAEGRASTAQAPRGRPRRVTSKG